MSDTGTGPEEGREGARPEVAGQAMRVMTKRTTRFSKEVVATMISLASAAFGVVAALAWNSAITELFAKWNRAGKIRGLFIYAVLVTLIGVVVIVLLGRLAARIKAEPVEFKYPGVPKT